MITAVFPGSFDPPTFGHLNVIERARAIFDELHVVIAVNKTKNYCFTEDERFKMMTNLVKQWDNVSVHLCDTLIVDYAERNNAQVLVRGIRNTADFSYEFDLSLLNKGLASDIETVFLYPFAINMNSLGLFAIVEAFIFVAILLFGLFFAIKKKMLRWV